MTEEDSLIAAARTAALHSYSPQSRFGVGAALRFADGAIVTGTNIENASFGLSLCAETVPVAKAMAEGRRGGLVEAAVAANAAGTVTPCGRCRQVLSELAGLGGTDPVILCCGTDEVRRMRLSELLPAAFGPSHISGQVRLLHSRQASAFSSSISPNG